MGVRIMEEDFINDQSEQSKSSVDSASDLTILEKQLRR